LIYVDIFHLYFANEWQSFFAALGGKQRFSVVCWTGLDRDAAVCLSVVSIFPEEIVFEEISRVVGAPP